jgi:hypothetical protein
MYTYIRFHQVRRHNFYAKRIYVFKKWKGEEDNMNDDKKSYKKW